MGTTDRNSYFLLGLGLCAAGFMLFILSYFVLGSTPFAALGISALIVGGVCLALAEGQPRIPPEASGILLESGLENISAIVEELGVNSKAWYLPSSMAGGKSMALIPLKSTHDIKLQNPVLNKRLIVKHGCGPDDFGLLLSTAGSSVSGFVSVKTDAGASDLEAALGTVLSNVVNLSDGARVVLEGDLVRVEVFNPRLEFRKMWVYEILGSPIAAIVASVVAEVLDKPVFVVGEQAGSGKRMVELEMAGRGH
jgi:hypothetical protein